MVYGMKSVRCLQVTHALPVGIRWLAPGRLAARRASQAASPSLPPRRQQGEEYVAALAYDLETTDGDPHSQTTQIIQIAVVCANSAKSPRPSFSRLVMPEAEITEGAAAVHGITRDYLLQHNAQPFPVVFEELCQWLDATFGSARPLAWAAHNGARFDHPILWRQTSALHPEWASSPRHAWLDTCQLAYEVIRKRGKGHRTLGTLYEQATGQYLSGAHDALVDADAVAVVWPWLVAQRDRYLVPTEIASLDPSAAPDYVFQVYLQTLAYRWSPPSDLMEVPGIGGYTAKRLTAAGVTNAKDLISMWKDEDQLGRREYKVRDWLSKVAPHAPAQTPTKLVSFLRQSDIFGEGRVAS